MKRYEAHLRCSCGQTHLITSGLMLSAGPSEVGTLAELYPNGDLPVALAELTHCWVWCDTTREYVEVKGAAQVVLVPRGEW